MHNNIEASCRDPQSQSENQSDKTRDSLAMHPPQDILKSATEAATHAGHQLGEQFAVLVRVCAATSTSDKIIRLTGSIIRFLKNFNMLSEKTKFDKFSYQLGQLRRLLRVNRICNILKQFVAFVRKTKRTPREYFDICFRSLMLFCDLNDVLLYLMQLKLIKERGMVQLRKNVTNFYFFQCVIWTCLLLYDYFTKQIANSADRNHKRVNIGKYLLDTATSHNDFSARKFSLSMEKYSVFSMVSSLIGLKLTWK